MLDLLAILGPAAGPYRQYLEDRRPLDERAGETAQIWTVIKLHSAYVYAVLDLADALDLAYDTDMLHNHISNVLTEPLAAYNRIRVTNVDREGRFNAARAVAVAAHNAITAAA